jgi:hypothetical protein
MGLEKMSTGTVEFDGKDREYDVVNRNIGSPCPQWFISYNNGVPFVSDEIPEEYRPHMVFHELYEFETLDPNDPESCIRALEKELERVPKDQINDYIPFRKGVFQSLVNFMNEHNPDMLPKIQQSLDHLIALDELTSP